jgi:Mn2+/Fe2+ NRAMP family transporter
VDVPDYLVWSILCIFLCLPLALVPILQSTKANKLKSQGDYAGAMAAAKTAKTWCWICVAVAVVLIVVQVAAIAGSS